jgi:hypothetical protein
MTQTVALLRQLRRLPRAMREDLLSLPSMRRLRARHTEIRLLVRAQLCNALPDGTRVRLVCECSRSRHTHDGVWVTSWTPRRQNDADTVDDYELTRESDGETTYATRGVLEPIEVSDGC